MIRNSQYQTHLSDLRVLIAGGGTGGHLFPAIAIGEHLQSRNPRINIHYVGSTFGIEADVLPVKALPHTLIPIRGFQRGVSLTAFGRNLLLPQRYFRAVDQTKKLFQEFDPHVVVGTGGYASAIPLKIAIKKGIPTLLQEQNSFPGVTTRWYAQKAQTICIAFEETRKYIKRDCILTGNPIRKGIQNGERINAAKVFNLDPEKQIMFLFGGSQGSSALNRIMNKSVKLLSGGKIQILWQTGNWQYHEFQHHESREVRVTPFIDRMADAYALSDLIVSRAGALTLSEITVCGKPSILVPFPAAAGDHQTKNAQALAQTSAALLLNEKELTPSNFVNVVTDLLHNRNQLNKMGLQSKSLGKPDATSNIVDHILKLVPQEFSGEKS